MRVVSTRVVYENRWMRVHEDITEHADGTPGLYGWIEKTPSALIVPIDDGHVWLIEQYRHPVGQRFWEFPQGAVEAGTIEPEALARIPAYVGADPVFDSEAAFASYVRSISPFGPHDDEQWDHLVRTTMAQRADGRFGFVYDPGIAEPFRAAAAPPDLWPLWDAIRCPTLLLRGEQSDLLSLQTAQAMASRGPRPRLVEFAGVGHAPTLMHPGQVQAVVEFLRR